VDGADLRGGVETPPPPRPGAEEVDEAGHQPVAGLAHRPRAPGFVEGGGRACARKDRRRRRSNDGRGFPQKGTLRMVAPGVPVVEPEHLGPSDRQVWASQTAPSAG
jgi:hypothetical protein